MTPSEARELARFAQTRRLRDVKVFNTDRRDGVEIVSNYRHESDPEKNEIRALLVTEGGVTLKLTFGS